MANLAYDWHVDKVGQTVPSFCSECKRSTNHEIVASFLEGGYAEGPGIYFWGRYDVIRCRGCDQIAFQRETWDSDSGADEDGERHSDEHDLAS